MVGRNRELSSEEFLTDEPVGDVRAALALVVQLDGGDHADAADLVTGVEPISLVEGLATLLMALVPLLGEDPWLSTAALLRQLDGLDGLDPAVLPTLAGMMVAMVGDESPITWRRRVQGDDETLRLPAEELVGLTLLTGLVVHVLDGAHGPGTVAGLVDRALAT